MSPGIEQAIVTRAAQSRIELSPASARVLAAHATAVLAANAALHLTTVVDLDEFVERHLGEAFEGAAQLDADISGALLDLGSGNGYPGIAVAAARPGLRAVLAEAAAKKARFLREVIVETPIAGVEVLESQVQRAGDIEEIGPVRVITARALGSWEKILPRVAPALHPDGQILLWAGETVETVRTREAWRKKLALESRHPLPGRERSWVWVFRNTRGDG